MNEEKKPILNRPTAAFVVSLIAGLWMLLAGSMAGWGFMGGRGWGGHMMSDGHHGGNWMWNHQMMHAYSFRPSKMPSTFAPVRKDDAVCVSRPLPTPALRSRPPS